jgi:hypothetical protein
VLAWPDGLVELDELVRLEMQIVEDPHAVIPAVGPKYSFGILRTFFGGAELPQVEVGRVVFRAIANSIITLRNRQMPNEVCACGIILMRSFLASWPNTALVASLWCPSRSVDNHRICALRLRTCARIPAT